MNSRTILISIFLLSLLLRLSIVFTNNEPVMSDQLVYDKLALSLLQQHEFSIEKGQPTAYITPLYPFFLSVIYFFFGHNYLYVKLAQGLLGSLVCLITYFIAKQIFNPPVAVLTFFFMAIHYFFIRYGLLLLTENLFILLLSLSILFLIKFYKNPSYFSAGLFGLFSSLATLTRSAYSLFPFMAVIILWAGLKFLNISWGKLLKFSLIIALCFILPIGIWTIRNYAVFKDFIPLGTEAGIVFYTSYNPPKEKIFDKTTYDEATLKTAHMSEVETSKFLLKQTIVSIKKDPTKIYKYIPLKIMYFFSIFDWTAFKIQCAYNFSTAFILPLSFLGVILALRKRPSYLNFVLLLPIIYFLFITLAVMGVPRTRLPVEPYLIIFAGFFVNYIYNLHKQNSFKIRIIGAICIWYLFNYTLYLNSQNLKVIARFMLEKVGLW